MQSLESLNAFTESFWIMRRGHMLLVAMGRATQWNGLIKSICGLYVVPLIWFNEWNDFTDVKFLGINSVFEELLLKKQVYYCIVVVTSLVKWVNFINYYLSVYSFSGNLQRTNWQKSDLCWSWFVFSNWPCCL